MYLNVRVHMKEMMMYTNNIWRIDVQGASITLISCHRNFKGNILFHNTLSEFEIASLSDSFTVNKTTTDSPPKNRPQQRPLGGGGGGGLDIFHWLNPRPRLCSVSH